MRIAFLFLFFVSCLTLHAQPPSGFNRGGSQGMNMGRFYGKVVDEQTNRPIDAASVQLFQSRFDSATKKKVEKIIGGQLTTSNGNFSLENIPVMGQYRLKITAIGFVAYDQPVTFGFKPGMDMATMMSLVDKDLGNIKLSVDSKQLEEIKITGTKPFMQMGVDRRIFNVEKSLVSQGQTATELMRNVPGLNVDIDGNVTLRNASPTIFVDGRPTTLTLDQIPADAIASVEMITNPSAKYDASGGMAGILNIVLKKNRKAGYNGNLRAGIDSRPRINLGGDLNARQGKFNFFLSGMYNQRKSIGTGESYRKETFSSPNLIFNQQTESERDRTFQFLRGGVDYFIDNRNTVTISTNIVSGGGDSEDLLGIITDTVYSSGNTTDLSRRNANSSFYFRNTNLAAGYKRLFPKAGMELTSDLNYSISGNESSGAFDTRYFDLNNSPKGLPIRQEQSGKGNSDNITFQTDFVTPLKENSKLEAGIRASIRNVQNENLNYIQDPITRELFPIVAVNANFRFREEVYAAYTTYSNKIGKNFSYQTGLRAERSSYEGTLLTNGSSFQNSFPISLFPSIFLTQRVSEKDDMQFSYSRRINRPNFFQLLPFVDYTDSLNISKGNPGLVPEFTTSLELSYQKNFKKGHSLLLSGWYKYTDDLITRFQFREPSAISGRDVIINTFINANSSQAYGMEITSRNPVAKWLDLTTNLNFYNSRINTENLSTSVQIDPIWSFFGKINAAVKLPLNYSFQLSGEYQSRTILPQGGGGGRGGGGMGRSSGGGGGWGGFVQTTAQGYVKSNYSVDFAIRKDFLKEKKGSLSVSINDIFKTRRYATFSESDFFVQEFSRIQDWRLVRLNFSYRFGKFDQTLFKRKNTRSGMDGMQEGMQMQ